jgi:hypothetical protein
VHYNQDTEKLGKLEGLLRQGAEKGQRDERGRKLGRFLAWGFGIAGTVMGFVQCFPPLERNNINGVHPGDAGYFVPVAIFFGWPIGCAVLGWLVGYFIGSRGK